jgi:hypothetical protein
MKRYFIVAVVTLAALYFAYHTSPYWMPSATRQRLNSLLGFKVFLGP